MKFVRRKCLSKNCPAMACPSQTGYCSYHDLQRTPYGKRPGDVDTPASTPWLLHAQPVTQAVQ
jgi:hypothetical protein